LDRYRTLVQASAAKLSLFLSRLKPGSNHRRGHRSSIPPAIKTSARSSISRSSSSSLSHPSRKSSSKSVPLATLNENVAVSSCCSKCGKSSSCSCKQQQQLQQQQHLAVTAPQHLLRSPTVVRQVSYHWRTVQRLTLKSQRSRDFGTQASFDESDIASLQSDANENASIYTFAKSSVDVSRVTNDVASSSSSASSTSYSTLPKVSFTDREIQEIRVAKETFFKEPKEKISPRIASTQKMLASSATQVRISAMTHNFFSYFTITSVL